MPTREYKRIDEATLLRIIEDNKFRLAGTLIVLAWRLGLRREEIYNLKWTDVSFGEKQVNLPDRSIPLDEGAYAYLYRRWETKGRMGEDVASDDRTGKHVHINYIPRCVRIALDKGDLPDISMIDLRHDFIIRQLQEHPWPYVVRVSGIAASSLHQNYSKYVRSLRGNQEECTETHQVNHAKLWAVIHEAGTSAEGLALQMNWYMDIKLQDAVALTWDQVDFGNHVIYLNGEVLSIPSDLENLLLQVYLMRSLHGDPHVLLSAKAERAISADRLSVLIRTALIRGGIEDMTTVNILRQKREAEGNDAILSLVSITKGITRSELMSKLPITQVQANRRLHRLTEQKKLVRIGATYYLPGTVVPPEEHYNVICSALEELGSAYRQDIAERLRIEPRKCGWILSRLVKEGKLVKTGQVYTLP